MNIHQEKKNIEELWASLDRRGQFLLSSFLEECRQESHLIEKAWNHILYCTEIERCIFSLFDLLFWKYCTHSFQKKVLLGLQLNTATLLAHYQRASVMIEWQLFFSNTAPHKAVEFRLTWKPTTLRVIERNKNKKSLGVPSTVQSMPLVAAANLRHPCDRHA